MASPILKMEVVDLEKLVELRKRRDALTAELADVDRQVEDILKLLGLNSGDSEEIVRTSQRRRRGTINGKIMEALKAAGESGMHVSDMASQTGLPKQDLERYLYSRSAREQRWLRKIGIGLFKYVEPEAAGTSRGNTPVMPKSGKVR